MTYTISHTNQDGSTGVAAIHIEADSEAQALSRFKELYPHRVVSAVGIKGREG